MAATLLAGTAQAATTVVGSMAGKFSVDPSGGASYSIPLEMQPGVHGLAPNLSLNYSSHGSIGPVGYGWSLSGLSVITRCPRTIDQDGTNSLPGMNMVAGQDAFCLDGDRLVVTSGTYGAANSTYQTEIDSFQKVTAGAVVPKGGCGQAQGYGADPASFTVVDKSGQTRTYGDTADSTVVGDGIRIRQQYGYIYCENPSRMAWPITRISDKYQNYVSFHYTNLQTQQWYSPATFYIDEIDYGSANGIVGKVLFDYSASGNATYMFPMGTFVEANPVQLNRIRMQNYSGTTVRSYSFAYQTNPNDRFASVSELHSVTECGTNSATCYNPTIFSYSGSGHSFTATPTQIGATTMPHRQILDLDGDGLPDYVYFAGDNTLRTVFGNNLGTIVNSGFNVYQSNGKYDFADAVVVSLHGDGMQELMLPFAAIVGQDPFGAPVYDSNWYWKVFQWNGSTTHPNLVLAGDPPVAGSATQLQAYNISHVAAVDLAGTGRTDLVFEYNGTLRVYANTGNGFGASPINTQIQVGHSSPQIYPVNYDGSGIAELYVWDTGVVQAVVTPNVNGPGRLPTVTGLTQIAYNVIQDDSTQAIFFLNSNGDGLSSAVVVEGTNDPQNPFSNQWTFYTNTGLGWDSQQTFNYAPFDTSGVTNAQIVDWYRDGRQEVVFPNGGTWHILNAGQGPVNGEDNYYATVNDLGVNVRGDANSTVFMDVDGDAEMDMLYTSSGSTYYIQNAATPNVLSQIRNGLGQTTTIDYLTSTEAAYTAFIQGVTSPVVDTPRIRAYAGSLYLVRDFYTDTGAIDSTTGDPAQIYTYYKYGGPAIDMWGRGFLGFYEVESINYNTGVFTLNKYSQTFPSQGMVTESTESISTQASPQPVVLSVTGGGGGIGGGIHCTFNKSNGEDTCTEPAPKQYTYEPASFDHGNVLSHTLNTIKTIQPYSGVYFPYVFDSVEDHYELAAPNAPQPPAYEEVETTSDYQTVGTGTPVGADIAPATITVTTTDLRHVLPNDVASVVTTNGYGKESTCPGMVTDVSVANTFNQDVSSNYPAKTESFTYDSNCFLKSDVKTIVTPIGVSAVGYPMTLEKDYQPDAFGNPLSTTVKGDGFATRVSSMTYDSTERFPATITNALGQSETLVYDGWGNKKKDTDANGNSVTYTYDGLQHPLSKMGPEPAVNTQWAYDTCVNLSSHCVANTAYAVKETHADGSYVTTQYDLVGGVLRVEKSAFNGKTVVQDTAYDLMGRAIATSKPYFTGTSGSSCWTFNTYDVLSRLISTDQPSKDSLCAGPSTDNNDRSTTVTYVGLATITMATSSNNTGNGTQTTTTVNNALGKAGKTTDAAGNTLVFSYDVWGNVLSATPPDQKSVSMVYDSAGNKLSMQDPDMGSWSYSYDAMGEILTQTDSKGQSVTNSYDLLGRLTKRIDADGVGTWQYDIGYGAGIGHLAYKVAANGAWEGYAYDAYGHTTDKITVVNGQEYWVTSTYDDQGRVSQLVYPDMNGVNVSGKPSAPANFAVSPDPNNNAVFDATWDAVPNGAVYHLYRSVGSTPQIADANEIYSGPDAGALDDGIVANGVYTWSLLACNGAVNTTDCSDESDVTLTVTLPPTVPGTPTVPSPDTHNKTISVSWTDSSLVSTTSGPISYVIQETSPNQAPTQITQSADSKNFSLSVDGAYGFSVRACASNACSAWTPVVSYNTVLTPNAPASITSSDFSVTPTSSPGTYTVSWPATTFSGGPVYYVLEEENQLDSSPQFQPITPANYTGTSFPLSKTRHGEFLYQVKTCDQQNTNVCSGYAQTSAQVVVTLPPTFPPGQISVPADNHTVGWDITWNASSLPPGLSGVSITYNLYEDFNGGNDAYVGSVTDGTDRYIGGHSADGTYTYKIQACLTDPVTTVKACTARAGSSGSYTTVIAPAVPVNITLPSTTHLDGTFTATWTEPNTAGHATSYSGKLGEWDVETHQYFWIDGHCSSPDSTPSGTCNPNTNGSLYVEIEACNTDDAVEPGVTACSGYSDAAGPITVNMPTPPVLSGGGNQPDGSDTLTWSTVTGVGHYMFYSRTQSLSTGAWSAWSNPGTNVGAATSKAVTLTSAQSAGQYYVQACDSVSCTGNSNVRTLTHTVPAAPALSGPSSTPDGSISISWNAPTGATSYQLWRSAEKNNTWLAYAQVTPNGRTYSETVGVLTQAVRYYVLACNVIGCGGQSNTLTVINNKYGTGCPPPPLQCQLMMEDDDGPSLHPMRFGANLTSKPVLGGELLEPLDDLRSMDTAMAVSGTHALQVVADAEQVTDTVRPAAKPVPAWPSDAMPMVKAPAYAALNQIQAIPASVIYPTAQPTVMYPAAYSDDAGAISARRAFVLAHAKPAAPALLPRSKGHMRTQLARAAAPDKAVWPPRPVDPRLSMYPPLRKDPRVQQHFASQGGLLPATLRRASSSEPAVANALMVQYQYDDPAGYLTSVVKLNPDGSQARQLWVPDHATAMGQVDQVTYDAPVSGGTGSLQINDTFDRATGTLGIGQLTTTSGQTLTANFSWDGYANLKERSVVQNGQTVLDETFTYDVMDRLYSISTTAGTYTNSSIMGYDVNGNIMANGAMTYAYNNPVQMANGYAYAQPHAVSSVTLASGVVRTYQYDLNGNLQFVYENGALTREVTWSSFNKPLTIKNDATGAVESFGYDVDHERLTTTLSQSSGDDTTIYIGGLFESEFSSATGLQIYRNYVMIGSTRIAVDTVTSGGGQSQSETLGFFMHDQVGSVIAEVTENQGGSNQQVALYSYDVWGKGRPTDNGGGQTPYAPLPNGQFMAGAVGQAEGFGGHENLTAVGLVEMEGRVYDPEIGRFLSADPNVQFPMSTQGYNRYTYVNDNPLSLNDPSGYFSLAGFIFGGIYGAEHPQQFGEGLTMIAPLLNAIPGCQVWCMAAADAVGGYLMTGSIGYGLRQGAIAIITAEAFGVIGAANFGTGAAAIFSKAMVSGLVGAMMASAQGGDAGTAFVGAVASGFASIGEGQVQGSLTTHVIVNSIVGGTLSRLTGGNFAQGALVAAISTVVSYAQLHEHGPCTAANDCRSLTSDEIAEAKKEYGDKIDYSRVRVIHGQFLPFQSRPMTPDGNIYWPNSDKDDTFPYCTDLTQCGGASRQTFIHEMDHVLQYQQGINVLANGFMLQVPYLLGLSNPYNNPGNIEGEAQAHERHYCQNNGGCPYDP